MAGIRQKRNEVDRFTGNAITSVSRNTPEQQKIVDELNARSDKRKVTIRTTTRTKRKK